MEDSLTASARARRDRMAAAGRRRELELCNRIGTIVQGHLLRIRQPLPYDVMLQLRADRQHQERDQ